MPLNLNRNQHQISESDNPGLHSPRQPRLPQLRKGPLIFVALFVAAMGFGLYWYFSPQQTSNVLSTTGLAANNFSHLQGSEVLAYNGMAFYGTDINTGKRRVLFDGLKLPTVKSLEWVGSQGAIMVFSGQYAGTEVKGILEAGGKARAWDEKDLGDPRRQITWYLDFGKRTWTYLSTQSLKPELTVYDSSRKRFYFAENNIGDSVNSRVYRLDVATKRIDALLDTNTVTDIKRVLPCSLSTASVCLVARTTANDPSQRLYSFDPAGKLTELFTTRGSIYDTGSSSYYAVGGKSAEGEVQPGELRSTASPSTYKLDFAVDENVHLRFSSKNDFYVIDKTANTYKTGTLKSGRVTVRDRNLQLGNTVFTGNLRSVSSADSGANLLVNASDNKPYLFGPKSITTLNQTVTGQAAQSAVEDCNKRHGTTSKFTASNRSFQIYVKAAGPFTNTVKAFSNCMSRSHTGALHGYNYRFIGINTDNRVVID